jgi:hypothetical protein
LRTNEIVGVELTLDRFLDMGVKGISLAIGYPLLWMSSQMRHDT